MQRITANFISDKRDKTHTTSVAFVDDNSTANVMSPHV